MRVFALAVITSIAAFVAFGAPAVGAATTTLSANPKVVIIAGPVGDKTSYFVADARAAAAEAAKYTTNVVTILTPHATWARVKTALQGASIVINMGHGNGWPSPYAPWQPYTKDGLGLNPVDTTSDNTTTQYHGEFYLAQDIRLAPNAIVLLNHLCYSAGNSEPGLPEPTVGVAHQRLDNFAAGWLRTGARAVISEAYHGAVEEVRALFTTRQTIDQLWRGMSDANGNVVTFPPAPGQRGLRDRAAPRCASRHDDRRATDLCGPPARRRRVGVHVRRRSHAARQHRPERLDG